MQSHDIIAGKRKVCVRAASLCLVSGLIGLNLFGAGVAGAVEEVNFPETTQATLNDSLYTLRADWSLHGEILAEQEAAGCTGKLTDEKLQRRYLNNLNAYRTLANLPKVQLAAADSAGWQAAADAALAQAKATKQAGAVKNSATLEPAGEYACRGDGALAAAGASTSAVNAGDYYLSLIDAAGQKNVNSRLELLNPALTTLITGEAVLDDQNRVLNIITKPVVGWNNDQDQSQKNPVLWPNSGYTHYDLLPSENAVVRIPGVDLAGAKVTVTPEDEAGIAQTVTEHQVDGVAGKETYLTFPAEVFRTKKAVADDFITYQVKVETAAKVYNYPVRVFNDGKDLAGNTVKQRPETWRWLVAFAIVLAACAIGAAPILLPDIFPQVPLVKMN